MYCRRFSRIFEVLKAWYLLLHVFVLRVFAAPLAVLRKLKLPGIFPEVFAGIVIKPLAARATKLNEFFGKLGLSHREILY
jgi:hypothetical protein